MAPAVSPTTSTVTLAIKPDPSHVRLVRLVAVALGRMQGIGEDVLDDIRLATGEACGRAVAAHLHHNLSQPIEVELRGGSGLEILVRDCVPLQEASGATATEVLRQAMFAVQPSSADDNTGSSGRLTALPEVIELIEGVSDKVTVDTGRSGTTVLMRWAGG